MRINGSCSINGSANRSHRFYQLAQHPYLCSLTQTLKRIFDFVLYVVYKYLDGYAQCTHNGIAPKDDQRESDIFDASGESS